MHNDVLLIFRAILLTYEPYREHGSIKMGQQKLMYRGIKINHKFHFNKVQHVAVNYSCVLLECTCVYEQYTKTKTTLLQLHNHTLRL